MTLLFTVIAAVVATVIWYHKAPEDDMKIGTLSLMYWGAALMWLVDAIFEYSKQPAAFFSPAPKELLNDSFLGISVVVLGLVAWLVMVLIQDPRKVIPAVLLQKNRKK